MKKLGLIAAFAGALFILPLRQDVGVAATTNTAETYKELNLFGDVFDKVRSDYVDDVSDDSLIEGAINGMLTALDPHSNYLNAKNFSAVKRDGLAKVFPRYAAQVALYQNFLDLADNPALLTITNADTCERLYFTVPFDARRAQEASDHAVQVIEATRSGELLPRLDPICEDFRCKMCSHRERCLRHE